MTPMQRGVLASLIASVVGTTIWTAVSYGSGWSLGVLAILVGAASGIAMGHASGRRIGATAGCIAALIALSAMLGGRYTLAQLRVGDMMEEASIIAPEDAIDRLAWEMFERDPERWATDEWDGEVPDALWSKAEREWNHMGASAQAEYLLDMEAEQTAAMDDAAPVLGGLALLFSIGFGGLLCMATGVGLAFKFGAAVIELVEEPDLAAAPTPLPFAAHERREAA